MTQKLRNSQSYHEFVSQTYSLQHHPHVRGHLESLVSLSAMYELDPRELVSLHRSLQQIANKTYEKLLAKATAPLY